MALMRPGVDRSHRGKENTSGESTNPRLGAGDIFEQRLLRTLAEVDVIGTDEGYEFCLGEYGLEAGMVRLEMDRGETLEVAAFEVFADTCCIDLDQGTVARIREIYDRQVAEEQAGGSSP